MFIKTSHNDVFMEMQRDFPPMLLSSLRLDDVGSSLIRNAFMHSFELKFRWDFNPTKMSSVVQSELGNQGGVLLTIYGHLKKF